MFIAGLMSFTISALLTDEWCLQIVYLLQVPVSVIQV